MIGSRLLPLRRAQRPVAVRRIKIRNALESTAGRVSSWASRDRSLPGRRLVQFCLLQEARFAASAWLTDLVASTLSTGLGPARRACPLGSPASVADRGGAARKYRVLVSGRAFEVTVDRGTFGPPTGGTVGMTAEDVERSADTAASAFTSPTSATSVLASASTGSWLCGGAAAGASGSGGAGVGTTGAGSATE